MKMICVTSALVCLTVAVSDFVWVFRDHLPAPVAPPAAVDPVGDRSLEIAVEVEGIAEANPKNRHLLSALFLTSGSMEVVFALPPHSEWTGALREEVRDEIAAAIERGAMQFQLATLPEDRGAVVQK
jgi:hypothetical protein